MTIVNIHEAKTQLSRYVDQAAAGEEIIIARSGKPIARLVSLSAPPKPRSLGLGAGRFHMPDHFDQLAQAEIADMFLGPQD
ncbi:MULTISPECIES: type II toxin-antitoxin system Phd/YefM family antitoxin [Acidithiobacillus]|jgi:prevent-host-death family protein|uniref:Antitoxin n=2 Tax=Acidithiobacillus TaxID=119977 RepID=A0A179BKS7_ACIFR|nr:MULTISPECIES: type II toxin-antitoxin system prevent-host-death family antitoxin [Acidithiobacillus]MDA8181704.1 type II toxin-antitoxin system prevent-host-death family antitoxin [Acidithiobacillus sp.]MBU2852976.1 type II toxin-antitoxin system Phd/YefM family antitoxin [Acidithiobacillus ferriphilus]MEB8487104.1 type II toxin-antitoxin system prevent-host-death family antitoxin [Acidithiobacillus ferriphilus]MEB8488600.1 type II toxin-antitoxin system prevent-host-death family antitoxin [